MYFVFQKVVEKLTFFYQNCFQFSTISTASKTPVNWKELVSLQNALGQPFAAYNWTYCYLSHSITMVTEILGDQGGSSWATPGITVGLHL